MKGYLGINIFCSVTTWWSLSYMVVHNLIEGPFNEGPFCEYYRDKI